MPFRRLAVVAVIVALGLLGAAWTSGAPTTHATSSLRVTPDGVGTSGRFARWP